MLTYFGRNGEVGITELVSRVRPEILEYFRWEIHLIFPQNKHCCSQAGVGQFSKLATALEGFECLNCQRLFGATISWRRKVEKYGNGEAEVPRPSSQGRARCPFVDCLSRVSTFVFRLSITVIDLHVGGFYKRPWWLSL